MRNHTHASLRTALPPLALAAFLAAGVPARRGEACGCFTPPHVSTPVIQAGERILFSVRSGVVTAYIQIQYSGQADQFGWLLPLPSVPMLEVGADEMFVQLQARTDPTFTLVTNSACQQRSGGLGCGGAASLALPRSAGGADLGAASPAVVVDSIGPYDYAVLKADSKQAMLDWLNQNKFFVPTGTDDAVGPYIYPGAYFLAIKLRAGKAAGDIQPVVVHYASDLPMIPIVLTSVGAVPNMGILVWILGGGRAIPRNYYHTVLDDAAYDWVRGDNYDQLFLRAIAEAPKHHTFVTEYAGTSTIMSGAIRVPSWNPVAQGKLSDPLTYASALRDLFPYPFVGPLKAILAAHLAEPVELQKLGVAADDFYGKLPEWLQKWRDQYPKAAPLAFDPVATTAEIVQRVYDPLRVADDAFRQFPYLTRLHTALSPADMTDDPVFSFNPGLPDVPNRHQATMNLDCDGNGVVTLPESRLAVDYPAGAEPPSLATLPGSLRIEMLREVGTAEIVTDNAKRIQSQNGFGSGCRLTPSVRARDKAALLGLAGAVGFALLGRRRRRLARARS